MQKKYKSILFICPYPSGVAPSQRFRFEQYLTLLCDKSFEIEIRPFISVATWNILYSGGNHTAKILGIIKGFLNRFILTFQVPQYDYIFIHREATPIGPPWFEWISARLLKKRIIYDFDDSIWLPNTSNENWMVSAVKWHTKVKSICRWSYKISCGNEHLATWARQYNTSVTLNPTTIDTANLHNPDLFPSNTSEAAITIGWTGSHSTLKYLEPLIPVFHSLINKYGYNVRIVVIANKSPTFNLPNLIFKYWNPETEIEDLMDFDIGIMPLPDDEWAKGKCGFKALQYLALSKPAVVSPIGVNAKIIENGVTGFLATSHAEWFLFLDRLCQDSDLRKKMGSAGRNKIISTYSVASNGANFLSLFE